MINKSQAGRRIAVAQAAGVIRLSEFMGRWGNTIGQWAFGWSIARRLGCRFQCPHWLGEDVFNIRRTPITPQRLKECKVDEIPTQPDRSIHGYFQYQKAFDCMRASELRKQLTVKTQYAERWVRPRKFYIAAHLRRGDYLKLRDRYAVVHRCAYERAILAAGYDLADVIWVSDEEPFGTGIYVPNLAFLYDFLTIQNADVVFRANSTFSFWAAALGKGKVYSPRVSEQVGDLYDATFEPHNACANFSTKIHTGTIHTDTELPV